MFGVVLWSDPEERKAVIWCEDHGDLAFYRDPDGLGPDVTLDAGDLVQFDMTVDKHMRFAHNPRLVTEGLYGDLPDSVRRAGDPAVAPRPAPPADRGSAEIIPFATPKPVRRSDDPRRDVSAIYC